MIEYKRNPQCECKDYENKEDLKDLKARLNIKNYWLRGTIYKEDGTSKECSCHRAFRLGGRYNRLADKAGLPTFEELSEMKYLGEGDSYTKLKSLPKLINDNHLKDVLVFVSGPLGCQKTTSLAKLMYNLIIDGTTVNYVNFSDLIEAFVAKSEDLSEILSTEWLIVDDCFEGETINFKTAYTQFYNLILKRRKPTIIATGLSREDILEKTVRASYNKDMLKKLFTKVDKYNSSIEFKDNVDKELIGHSKVDIWSLA